MIFRIDIDREKSVGKITDLYRALVVSVARIESASWGHHANMKRAEELAVRLRCLCIELENLLSVAYEGDHVAQSQLFRRIAVIEREAETLTRKLQALQSGDLYRVETGWRR